MGVIMSEKYDDALQALVKINTVIAGFRGKYPDIKQKKVTSKIETEEKALKIIERVEAIIMNYNKGNAERKLKNVIAMLRSYIIQ